MTDSIILLNYKTMTTSIKYMKQLRLLDLTYHTIPPTDEVTIER